MKVKTNTGEIITLEKNQTSDTGILGRDANGVLINLKPIEIQQIVEYTIWELLKGLVSKLLGLIFKK